MTILEFPSSKAISVGKIWVITVFFKHKKLNIVTSSLNAPISKTPASPESINEEIVPKRSNKRQIVSGA